MGREIFREYLVERTGTFNQKLVFSLAGDGAAVQFHFYSNLKKGTLKDGDREAMGEITKHKAAGFVAGSIRRINFVGLHGQLGTKYASMSMVKEPSSPGLLFLRRKPRFHLLLTDRDQVTTTYYWHRRSTWFATTWTLYDQARSQRTPLLRLKEGNWRNQAKLVLYEPVDHTDLAVFIMSLGFVYYKRLKGIKNIN